MRSIPTVATSRYVSPVYATVPRAYSQFQLSGTLDACPLPATFAPFRRILLATRESLAELAEVGTNVFRARFAERSRTRNALHGVTRSYDLFTAAALLEIKAACFFLWYYLEPREVFLLVSTEVVP